MPATVEEETASSSEPRATESQYYTDLEDKARQLTNQDLTRSYKQTYKGTLLLWLAWQSTGVIYGDIGTSPLYVYSSTFSVQPSYDDLVGALSIIIWSLILIVTVKYCFIVLWADDDGQGGTFALYSLLSRYANISRADPLTSNTLNLQRYKTHDIRAPNKTVRALLERSAFVKTALRVISVTGISLVMADGVLTPAQSVLGAIQGIRVTNPDLGTNTIVGISCAILVFLFCIQPFGTARLGTLFAPVVVIWLLFNFCCGVYNLALYDASVLRAFSPHYAFLYLVRNGRTGWESLGGIMLAFTGVEALFADLGAFGRRAIQLSWVCLAFPCLLIAYIGQAAYIAQDSTGTAFLNPFFSTVPPGTLYFSLVIAVLAAVVASQAMITSSFQLLSQVIKLSYFPRVRVVYTSKKFHDQVYIPFINWPLMVGTIIVTAVYNNTTSLGNAYGLCVITVTMITTTMVSLVALVMWRLNFLIVLVCFLFFFGMEGAFFTANLRKIPEGAWFTLVLSSILVSIFILWRWGKEKQWAVEARDKFIPSNVVQVPEETEALNLGEKPTAPTAGVNANDFAYTGAPLAHSLTASMGGGKLTTTSGMGIFFDKTGTMSPQALPLVFVNFVRKFQSRPQVCVFFHMRPLQIPSVPVEERFLIMRASPYFPNCYKVTLRHGYTDEVLTADLGNTIVEQIVQFIAAGTNGYKVPEDLPPRAAQEMSVLNAATSAQVLYILGKQMLRVGYDRDQRFWKRNFLRDWMLEVFLWVRENSRTKMASLDMDYNQLVEIGYIKTL